MTLRYLSVCSGIEAVTVAWHPLGWTPIAFAEIERFPVAVLAYHYATVPNWGDLTRFHEWPDATFDLLVGGTPCQSFSVAGLRKGLDDPRGSLMLAYLAVARRYRPVWVVWENVPGVLSSDGGRAFGTLLGGLAELGYGFAYRVLDAQYFGLAQRRARVFVVGHLGDWRRAAAVLFERESLSGHPAPSRETGEDITGSLAARASAGGGLGTDFDCDGGVIAPEISNAICALDYKGSRPEADQGAPLIAHSLRAQSQSAHDPTLETYIAHTLRGEGFDAMEDGTGRGIPLVAHSLDSISAGRCTEDGTGRGTPIVPIDLRQASRGEKLTNNRAQGSGGPCGHGIGNEGDPAFTVSERGQAIAFSVKDHGADAGELAPTLRAGAHDQSHANGGVMPAVAFQEAQTGCREYDTAGTLRAGGPGHDPVGTRVRSGMQVRRLTPRECERLQGFPDDYTLVPYRGKLAKDGPRYKALGNSMAVSVMRWIGERIVFVKEVAKDSAA